MRNFFIKALVLLFGSSLLLNLLGTLADRVAPLDDWRIEHQQRVADLQARNDRIQAIALGNSHSDSIDYSVLGVEGQSLAFAAADLFEIEKYAASMADRLPHLQTVFISLSYYSFSRDNSTFEPFRTRRIQFYSMIPAWSPVPGDDYNFLLGKLESYTHVMSVARSDSWQGVWVGLAADAESPSQPPYDGIRTDSVWGECFHYTEEQLKTHAQEIAGRNVSSSTQMASAHPELAQDAFKALARTIVGLQSSGLRVILFTPPYYEAYNTVFEKKGPDIIGEMRRMTERLRQTYQVDYYDFSADPEFTSHPELFYNSDHLNECGKRVFSARLLEVMSVAVDFDK